MDIIIDSVHLGDVVVIRQERFTDERGFFLESYRQDKFEMLGLPDRFIQDNHSGSTQGVLRGLHFQWNPPMGKLMRVTAGTAFLVAVDIRKNSDTFGQWVGSEISSADCRQIWAPAGFARGFCALSEFVEVQYKCTGIYNPKCEGSIRWDDPAIGIKWPLENPLLSDKDRNAPTLEEWAESPESDLIGHLSASFY